MSIALDKAIQMVDVKSQYLKIKDEIDKAVLDCIGSTQYINGPKVKEFKANLESYLDVKHVIPCANGTDALQIALMACDLQPGDEVIVPSFTYVATAEVIALLQLKPIMVDVDADTFNTTAELIESHITPKTKVIVPVHLYGQACDMEGIMAIAKKHDLYVIEDNAQAIGAAYTTPDGKTQKAGTIGHIGCTSFYPSKNLGCYGDGGAIFTNDDELAAKLQMIANHGQNKRYHHAMIGVNSRLDSIQAVVLTIKLKYLDQYSAARQAVADAYDTAFKDIAQLQTPQSLRVKDGRRDAFNAYLTEKGIPSMIYYPIPLYKQAAYAPFYNGKELANTEQLCQEVISLPMHTEMDAEVLNYICTTVKAFFE